MSLKNYPWYPDYTQHLNEKQKPDTIENLKEYCLENQIPITNAMKLAFINHMRDKDIVEKSWETRQHQTMVMPQ